MHVTWYGIFNSDALFLDLKFADVSHDIARRRCFDLTSSQPDKGIRALSMPLAFEELNSSSTFPLHFGG